MLRLKTKGRTGIALRSCPAPAARPVPVTLLAALLSTALFLLASAPLSAQATRSGGKIGPEAPVTYDNRYEVYGGVNLMNFQAGQDLPKRMNLGGGELAATYWLTGHLGVTGDYRYEAGTTPVFPSPGSTNPSRELVTMNIGMAGVQYRGPKNHYAAINYHAYAGVDSGVFHGPSDFNVGLYDNTIKPIAALGGSLDYNRSKNIAIRLQPDLILEHFGTETREFFSLSGGVIYRFGQR